jgi:hypothetical protein
MCRRPNSLCDMSSNVRTQSSFLRSQWQFPDDNPQALAVQMDRAYIAIANSVNEREIGLFPTSMPVQNGKIWFVDSSKRQAGLCQVFTFTGTGNIAHNINLSSLAGFTCCYGSFTDGTNWYGAIFGSNVAIAGQVSFYITPTNIVVLGGDGAPSITSGTIILEWRSQV